MLIFVDHHFIAWLESLTGMACWIFLGRTRVDKVIHSIGNLSLQGHPFRWNSTDPAELLASERMEKLLQMFKEMTDILIIDTPPTILSDPVVLSAKVDGVLVVVRPGETKIGNAQVMMEQLKLSGARIMGVVLNPISRRNTNYYSRYHYYSSQYYSSGTEGKTKIAESEDLRDTINDLAANSSQIKNNPDKHLDTADACHLQPQEVFQISG